MRERSKTTTTGDDCVVAVKDGLYDISTSRRRAATRAECVTMSRTRDRASFGSRFPIHPRPCISLFLSLLRGTLKLTLQLEMNLFNLACLAGLSSLGYPRVEDHGLRDASAESSVVPVTVYVGGLTRSAVFVPTCRIACYYVTYMLLGRQHVSISL